MKINTTKISLTMAAIKSVSENVWKVTVSYAVQTEFHSAKILVMQYFLENLLMLITIIWLAANLGTCAYNHDPPGEPIQRLSFSPLTLSNHHPPDDHKVGKWIGDLEFSPSVRIIRREDTDRVMASTDNSNSRSSMFYNAEIAKDIVMAVY